MSLKEDLARNRAVFERLTGTAGEPEYPRRNLDFDVSPQVQSFSFSRANPREYKRETGMALSYDAPAVEYPTLRESTGASASDPLDTLYRRLGTEARQSSQLSGEEDF